MAKKMSALQKKYFGKKTKTSTRRKSAKRSIGGASYTVVAAKPRTRTVTRTVKVPGRSRVRTVVRTVTRRAKSAVSSGLGSSRKEILTSVVFLVGGYLGGMAIANLAPLPDAIKNSKFKGAVFLVGGLLVATRLKDKRFRLAAIGAAAYGGVTLAVDNVPQLSALRGLDVLGGSRGSVVGERQKVVGASYRNSPSY